MITTQGSDIKLLALSPSLIYAKSEGEVKQDGTLFSKSREYGNGAYGVGHREGVGRRA